MKENKFINIILIAAFFLLSLFFMNSNVLVSSLEKADVKSSSKSANEIKDKTDMKHSYAQGEIIIKFFPETSDEKMKIILERFKLKTIKKISPRGVYLFKIEDNITVDELIKSLKQIKEIEYAEPNYIRTIQHDQRGNNEE